MALNKTSTELYSIVSKTCSNSFYKGMGERERQAKETLER
jgi:hypothetical protein